MAARCGMDEWIHLMRANLVMIRQRRKETEQPPTVCKSIWTTVLSLTYIHPWSPGIIHCFRRVSTQTQQSTIITITMPGFTGTFKLIVIEATDLRPTEYSTRHGVNVMSKSLDPYVSIDVDDIHIDRSTTKQRNFNPIWNEHFSSEVHNAQCLLLTVFHDAAIPPDDFVANCTITFDDLLTGCQKGRNDFWVSKLLSFSMSRYILSLMDASHFLPWLLTQSLQSIKSDYRYSDQVVWFSRLHSWTWTLFSHCTLMAASWEIIFLIIISIMLLVIRFDRRLTYQTLHEVSSHRFVD